MVVARKAATGAAPRDSVAIWSRCSLDDLALERLPPASGGSVQPCDEGGGPPVVAFEVTLAVLIDALAAISKQTCARIDVLASGALCVWARMADTLEEATTFGDIAGVFRTELPIILVPPGGAASPFDEPVIVRPAVSLVLPPKALIRGRLREMRSRTIEVRANGGGGLVVQTGAPSAAALLFRAAITYRAVAVVDALPELVADPHRYVTATVSRDALLAVIGVAPWQVGSAGAGTVCQIVPNHALVVSFASLPGCMVTFYLSACSS